MKNKINYLLAIALIVAATACQQGESVKEVKLESPLDSASYAIGVLVGTNNKQQLANAPGGADMNLEITSLSAGLAICSIWSQHSSKSLSVLP